MIYQLKKLFDNNFFKLWGLYFGFDMTWSE